MVSLLQDLWNNFLEKIDVHMSKLITIVIILVIGYIIIRILIHLIEKFFDKADFDRSVETFLENVARVVLWGILIIIILANLGVNVSGLIAGLGIMGFIVGFAGMLILGVSGGIAALGDTLFPAESLTEALQADFSPTTHIFLRLRLLHPVIAVFVGLYIIVMIRIIHSTEYFMLSPILTIGLPAMIAVQIITGAVNVILLAPVFFLV